MQLLAKAHHWWGILKAGEVDIGTLAAQEKVTPSWMTGVVRLAFLSPDVTAAIIAGRQRADVSGTTLLATRAVHPLWKRQAVVLMPTGETVRS